jgi:hypothetical protein
MEEQEALPRREAVLGVGLLGVLLLGLVGTIVIRIVHAKPRRGDAPSAASWASQSLPPAPVADAPIFAAQAAQEEAPPATPIPIVDANEGIVARASTAEPTEASSAADAPAETAPVAPQRPAFVAPGGAPGE